LDDVVSAFSLSWHQEISVHFADENRLIGPMPLKESTLKRLHDEHLELAQAIGSLLQKPHSALNAVQVGRLLEAHIRWEEHTLFPEIETTLSVQALTELAERTQLIEKSRRRKL
jgi:hemerythrin-like domain-containing protein